ncbi:MAG: hypothetical protein ACJAR2_000038 [Ilumatobacter sp.]|jgi:hypothetical protein
MTVYSKGRMTQVSGDPEVEVVLKAAVGHGLEGGAPWPSEPLEDRVFTRVLQVALHDRLLGVLAEAVTNGALELRTEQLARLTGHHTRWQAHALGLERSLLLVAERFGAEGIDFRVLKGVALAHVVYPDPSWRVSADLDLLIPSDRFDDAVAIGVDGLGGEQELPELRPGFDREFGKESMVRVGPYELDLHRTFVTGPFGLTIELDELFGDQTPFSVGGQELLALGPLHQLLHACYNAALGDYPVRLCAVRDLLLCRDRLEVDLDEFMATAHRWHGAAIVRRAAELVIDIAGPDASGSFLELSALSVPRREAWLLRSYLTPARSYSRPLASVAVIRGGTARLRYARAVLAPSATYLASRGWTKRSHLSRAIRRLRRHG